MACIRGPCPGNRSADYFAPRPSGCKSDGNRGRLDIGPHLAAGIPRARITTDDHLSSPASPGNRPSCWANRARHPSCWANPGCRPSCPDNPDNQDNPDCRGSPDCQGSPGGYQTCSGRPDNRPLRPNSPGGLAIMRGSPRRSPASRVLGLAGAEASNAIAIGVDATHRNECGSKKVCCSQYLPVIGDVVGSNRAKLDAHRRTRDATAETGSALPWFRAGSSIHWGWACDHVSSVYSQPRAASVRYRTQRLWMTGEGQRNVSGCLSGRWYPEAGDRTLS